jgi:hypothetical protein
MGFQLNCCKNVFRPLFCHFLTNSAILRPPIFSGYGQFFGVSFELFGRKFGHLATVVVVPRSPVMVNTSVAKPHHLMRLQFRLGVNILLQRTGSFL